MLGEKWKALSEKQRTPYEAKAAADKKRYEEEKAAYNVSCAYFHDCMCLLMTNIRLKRRRRKRSPSKGTLHLPLSLVSYALTCASSFCTLGWRLRCHRRLQNRYFTWFFLMLLRGSKLAIWFFSTDCRSTAPPRRTWL